MLFIGDVDSTVDSIHRPFLYIMLWVQLTVEGVPICRGRLIFTNYSVHLRYDGLSSLEEERGGVLRAAALQVGNNTHRTL